MKKKKHQKYRKPTSSFQQHKRIEKINKTVDKGGDYCGLQVHIWPSWNPTVEKVTSQIMMTARPETDQHHGRRESGRRKSAKREWEKKKM